MAKVAPTPPEEKRELAAMPPPQATVNIPAVAGQAAPDFLTTAEGDGNLQIMRQYVILPRLKVVQALSREPFKPPYQEGDVVATPIMVPIATNTNAGDVLFHLVPILFYPEWITWNPRNAGLPAIKERSYDSKSSIAMKARNPETRRENLPDGRKDSNGQPLQMRHLEHLNFVFDLVNSEHELAGLPLTLSFASGEHQAGSRFSTLISTRRAKYTFGCVFAAKMGVRKNEKGVWRGIDIDNPEPSSGVSPWVTDKAKFEQYMEAWKEYKEVYDQKRLQVNMDDLDDPDAEVTTAAGEHRF